MPLSNDKEKQIKCEDLLEIIKNNTSPDNLIYHFCRFSILCLDVIESNDPTRESFIEFLLIFADKTAHFNDDTQEQTIKSAYAQLIAILNAHKNQCLSVSWLEYQAEHLKEQQATLSKLASNTSIKKVTLTILAHPQYSVIIPNKIENKKTLHPASFWNSEIVEKCVAVAMVTAGTISLINYLRNMR